MMGEDTEDMALAGAQLQDTNGVYLCPPLPIRPALSDITAFRPATIGLYGPSEHAPVLMEVDFCHPCPSAPHTTLWLHPHLLQVSATARRLQRVATRAAGLVDGIH